MLSIQHKMKAGSCILILFSAMVLLSACQSEYIVSVYRKTEGVPITAEVHTKLNAVLLSDGFHGVEEGHWRRVDGERTFWYGQAQFEVFEDPLVGETDIYIHQYNGAEGRDSDLARRIKEDLESDLPYCTVNLKKHVIYGPSWAKN
jgi:hypothetical protein